MIQSFANKTAEDIYHGSISRHARKLPAVLHDRARRLLDQINAAPSLNFLKIPPGNRLEKLSGDYNGFWSVRINEQWRVVFKWQGEDVFEVAILDYH
ncbi:MAG: plasmid maintenance system killer family protein [Deltaproteobacteria bacterium RIFOXYD12_FULL_57_12]|nr:MAG: plasmid maintenance system killer family protein [Deltaproteobacteria bacterium RIFOXYD12_FULL_57_12]